MNKLRKDELSVSAAELARRTRSCVLEYLQVYIPTPKKQSADKWRPPTEEFVKINLDDSFVQGEDHTGWELFHGRWTGRSLERGLGGKNM